MPPSYIRVRAVVWAYGRGQTDTQTRVTTIHFASSTTHANCNKLASTWRYDNIVRTRDVSVCSVLALCPVYFLFFLKLLCRYFSVLRRILSARWTWLASYRMIVSCRSNEVMSTCALKLLRCRSGSVAVADGFLRIARLRIRIRHLTGSRRLSAHTALSVGSTANHCTCPPSPGVHRQSECKPEYNLNVESTQNVAFRR